MTPYRWEFHPESRHCSAPGSRLLTGGERFGRGFRIEVIGFSDGLKRATGRCAWADSSGDQLFGDLLSPIVLFAGEGDSG